MQGGRASALFLFCWIDTVDWRGTTRLHPAASPAPHFPHRQILQSLSVTKADEADGLTPASEGRAAVGGSAALRMRACPLRVLRLRRNRQLAFSGAVICLFCNQNGGNNG